MRFVHVEDFIHPDAGYQVNLLSRLQVEQGHEVIVVTSELKKIPDFLTAFFGKDNIEERDKNFFELAGVKIIRVPLLGFYSGRSIYFPKLFKIVDSLEPDVLFVHGEDTLMGMQFIWRAHKLNYPIVLDCHMVEMASMNRFRNVFRLFYRIFITPRILKNNIPLIRVVDVDFVEKCLAIPLNKTILLSFGTDTAYFKPNKEAYYQFREKHGISAADFVVMYAGKLDVYKGGLFLAEAIKEEIVSSTGKRIVFIIIGNTDGDYGKEVEKLFMQSQNKIVRFPTQPYYDLATFYQSADLSVFPKQCSMSFFEVQSCALPVVFESNEINNSRSKFGNGFTFIPGEIADFRIQILKCADMPEEEYTKMKNNARKYVIENFNFVPIAQKFTDIMVNEAKKFQEKKNRHMKSFQND